MTSSPDPARRRDTTSILAARYWLTPTGWAATDRPENPKHGEVDGSSGPHTATNPEGAPTP